MIFKSTRFLALASLLLFISGISLVFISVNTADQKLGSKLSPSPTLQVNAHEAGASAKNIQGLQGEKALVIKVVDGDTIEVQIGNDSFKVRLVGIDTPETVDPRRPVGCFGKQASNETKSLLSGKEVILQKDISDTDKFKRLLRYVYLPLENGKLLFVNDYLVREGFAKVYTYPPDVKFNQQFLEAQKSARENKKGLWGSC